MDEASGAFSNSLRLASSTAISFRIASARRRIAGICPARAMIADTAATTIAAPARGRISVVRYGTFTNIEGGSTDSAISPANAMAVHPNIKNSASIANRISVSSFSIDCTDRPLAVIPFTSKVMVGNRLALKSPRNVTSIWLASPDNMPGDNEAPTAADAAKPSQATLRTCNQSSQLLPNRAKRSQSVP